MEAQPIKRSYYGLLAERAGVRPSLQDTRRSPLVQASAVNPTLDPSDRRRSHHRGITDDDTSGSSSGRGCLGSHSRLLDRPKALGEGHHRLSTSHHPSDSLIANLIHDHRARDHRRRCHERAGMTSKSWSEEEDVLMMMDSRSPRQLLLSHSSAATSLRPIEVTEMTHPHHPSKPSSGGCSISEGEPGAGPSDDDADHHPRLPSRPGASRSSGMSSSTSSTGRSLVIYGQPKLEEIAIEGCVHGHHQPIPSPSAPIAPASARPDPVVLQGGGPPDVAQVPACPCQAIDAAAPEEDSPHPGPGHRHRRDDASSMSSTSSSSSIAAIDLNRNHPVQRRRRAPRSRSVDGSLPPAKLTVSSSCLQLLGRAAPPSPITTHPPPMSPSPLRTGLTPSQLPPPQAYRHPSHQQPHPQASQPSPPPSNLNSTSSTSPSPLPPPPIHPEPPPSAPQSDRPASSTAAILPSRGSSSITFLPPTQAPHSLSHPAGQSFHYALQPADPASSYQHPPLPFQAHPQQQPQQQQHYHQHQPSGSFESCHPYQPFYSPFHSNHTKHPAADGSHVASVTSPHPHHSPQPSPAYLNPSVHHRPYPHTPSNHSRNISNCSSASTAFLPHQAYTPPLIQSPPASSSALTHQPHQSAHHQPSIQPIFNQAPPPPSNLNPSYHSPSHATYSVSLPSDHSYHHHHHHHHPPSPHDPYRLPTAMRNYTPHLPGHQFHHTRSPIGSDHPSSMSQYFNSPMITPLSPFEPSYQRMASPIGPNRRIPPSSGMRTGPFHQSYPHQPPPFFPTTGSNETHSAVSPLRRSAYSKSHLHSPFASPRPHWQNQSRMARSPASQSHSPRPSFLPKSPYSSVSSPSTQGPRSPSSLPIGQPLVRGSLAQAKLRGHFSKPDHLPFGSLFVDQSLAPASPYPDRSALPRPPTHSEHALWVGNIPNDASHEELWKFFAGRLPTNVKALMMPSSNPSQVPTAGVESIHLIARSNCAFVNYISREHLEHAIANCNGKPLRSMDPYCKPLLCRVRKPEDNIKSGVGAQRIGGMHRSWVKRFEQGGKQRNPPSFHPLDGQKIRDNPEVPTNRTSSTLTAASNQSQSTSSSFLATHFPRRYFILKAYTDEDLKLSVERSIWVSQSHNEPILDQAYRTSPEGVYLIFSANQSGEFFGYAKMAGPIWRPGRRYSAPTSPATDSGKLLRARSVSISGSTTRKTVGGNRDSISGQGGLFGSEEGLTSSSPRALTPVEGEPLEKVFHNWNTSPSRRSLPIFSSHFTKGLRGEEFVKSASVKPIEEEKQIERPAILETTRPRSSSRTSSRTTTGSRQSHRSSESSAKASLMTGKPFKVEWIRVQRLAFYRTKNLRNPFNGNREVKVSRDGTEVEPSIGQAILEEIDKEYYRLNP